MTKPPSPLPFLAGGGELGALMRAFDWRRTPLGPPEGPHELVQLLASLPA